MTNFIIFALMQTLAVLCVALIIFFKWEPLVGIGLYCAAFVSALAGPLWLMFGPGSTR